jgi:F420-dependent oxidoreductase-like protein
MTHLSFGIKTAPQHTTYPAMLKIWQQADAEPLLEHAWLFDHFYPIIGDSHGPCLEGWTTLTALAASTTRLRVGLMVTGNTYRHPPVLAKIASTLDVISNGRLDFGLGAGWNEEESTAYNIPLYKPGERLRRLEESCEIIKRMWTETSATFEGRYYQVKDAYCEPKPIQKPTPPFVIGGGGEQLTLRIVAKYASIWNLPGGSAENYKHKSDILDQHCAEIGRDPASITRSIQLAVNPDDIQETVNTIKSFIDIGVTHIILTFRTPYPDNIVKRSVSEIVEPLKNQYA